jgi:hypothetical protein
MVMLLSMTTLKQTQFYRSRSFVTAQLYTGSALANLGSLNVTDRLISPIKLEYKQTFLQEALRNSRFNTTMKGGAWEIESSEFGSTVLAMVGPAVSQDAKHFLGGITTATKLLLLLWSGCWTRFSSLLTNCYCCFAGQVDGVFAKVLYDNAAIGGYIKVTGTTVTSANIAAECAKIYSVILKIWLSITSCYLCSKSVETID